MTSLSQTSDDNWGRPYSSQTRRWLFGLFLMMVTLVAYWPALHGGFVWDDDVHISINPALRSLRGLWEIWFKPGATCQYYPLSFTAFWVGYHLWGLNPVGYHVQNVLLHGLVAILLWQVLERLKIRGAWLAGAIFALHPVCVMSVAWMTELKNTLSGVLALGTTWAYVRFVGLGVYGGMEWGAGAGKEPRPEWRYYVSALVLFQLAIFAKTAVSFLPVTLLLMVWWQRERLRWREVWPLIPMLGIAVVMGGVTIYVERHSGGASGKEFNIPLLERVLISGRSFWFYLGKLLVPYRLTFIYERWKVDGGVWWQYMYPLATVGLLAGLWGMRGRLGKGLFVAMMHFYVSTSLLILMVVLYMTNYSFVSDHWQYFGCMSVITLAAVGISLGMSLLGKGRIFLEPAAGGALLVILGALTWNQCRMYADTKTLWQTTLKRNPVCWMAYNNLGTILAREGRTEEAIAHLQQAMTINPDCADAHYNLGGIFFQQGRMEEAIAQFQQTLAIKPDHAEAHYNLGNLFLQQGQVDKAIAQFEEALAIKPGYVEAHYDLGNILLQQGQVDGAIAQFQKTLAIKPNHAEAHYNLGNIFLQREQVNKAIAQFEEAVAIKPGYTEAHNNLGSAFLQQGRMEEAIAQFQQTLAIKPNHLEARYNLGGALLQQGRVEKAIAQFRQTLAIEPDFVEAQRSLAWVLATSPQASLRNGIEAVRLAERAEQLDGGKSPVILATLAAAYAEAGRFPEAIETVQHALQLAEAQSRTALAGVLQAQMKFYQAGTPFRDTIQTRNH